MKKLLIIASALTAIMVTLLLLNAQLSSHGHIATLADNENSANDSQTTAASHSAIERPAVAQVQSISYNQLLLQKSNHSGKGSYTGTFDCAIANGDSINVTVTNQGTSPVLFKVSQDDNDFGYIKLASKAQLTRTFQSTSARDISGHWRVYVTNDSGSYMNLQISAGQFDASN